MGVLTASDSRSAETDESGRLIRDLLTAAGHRVEYYEVLPDDPARIRKAVLDHLQNLDAIIVNGGTGIAARDSTIEAVRVLLDKELEGFGELFRYLSYQQNRIGSLFKPGAGGNRGRQNRGRAAGLARRLPAGDGETAHPRTWPHGASAQTVTMLNEPQMNHQ